ncbi:isopentenyl-diphosphate delta-isomerase [Leuconostoc litchii]|uniref:Isopentenyl-diphosphate delta-isomerase n=1 Tax=Leuconostoc litchii TaxID=1981069 RepID=A0A6P2CQT1_9LACO|nr:type 2 isopentenyl-diphosphate Delta-isomerase [Leuconostoc litchii]TYC46697.1 type 2 isopentenyl-diphosphate Delta-isomerase [Leuconostoc litchii]GMA70572.1 isopentenyl-diphosphate delta-isomerase [Leuconostoc litchii]
MTESAQSHRKDEHLSISAKLWRNRSLPKIGATYDDVRWLPNTFPEMSVSDVDVSTSLMGHTFKWPFYIEAMTGGSNLTAKINTQLSQIAAKSEIAMAVGSQSIALKEPDIRHSFEIVRKNNPTGFLLANLGADHPLANVREAIQMIDANAIELHVNAAQELVMAEGDRSFYWLDNLAEIIAKTPVPVIIKEVGFGMSQDTFKKISALNPAAINVGGANGTNFSIIERRRNHLNESVNLDNYGFSTVESLIEAKIAKNDLPLIATGGIENVNHIITSLMLGASLTSSAGYMLTTLLEKGQTPLLEEIYAWQQALPRLMTLLGAKNIMALQKKPVLYSSELQNFIAQQKASQ